MRSLGRTLYFRYAAAIVLAAVAMVAVIAFALHSRVADAIVLAVGLTVILAVFTAITVFTGRALTSDLEELGDALEKMVIDNELDHIPQPRLAELSGLARDLDTVAVRARESYLAMATERDRLETVLDNINAGIIVVGRDGRVDMINPLAEKLLGTAEEFAVGRNFTEIHHSVAVDRAVEKAMMGAEVTEEISLSVPGSRKVMLVSSPVRAERGKVTGVICILEDITSRRRLERVRRDFVANVSHELRTPVANMRAVVDALLAGGIEDVEAASRFIHDLDIESARLAGIIDDLLIISRLESDGTAPRREEFALDELISEVVEERRELAASAGVEVVFVAGDGPVMFSGDRKLVYTALTNLVDNAIKYNRPGGSVEVRAAYGPESLNVSVSDTGIGIPRRDALRVFQRFYRVDRARSRETGGTGLGLSIVKHIAEVHGGRVTLESTEGEGSTFTIEFPVSSSLF